VGRNGYVNGHIRVLVGKRRGWDDAKTNVSWSFGGRCRKESARFAVYVKIIVSKFGERGKFFGDVEESVSSLVVNDGFVADEGPALEEVIAFNIRNNATGAFISTASDRDDGKVELATESNGKEAVADAELVLTSGKAMEGKACEG
jgi:hypothetical protein